MARRKFKTILVVDDEALFRKSLAQGLTQHEPGWRILTAEDGAVARRILEEKSVDLVLTDLSMPVADGFGLLAYLAVEHPWIPVLVMTAFGTEETAARLRTLGFEGFLEKPLDFEALVARISRMLDGRAAGFVRGISLPTFLQILELDGKSCRLRVRSGARTGTLEVVEGALYDARTATCEGEAAAAEIVCWPDAELEMSEIDGVPERRVRRSLRELMFESFSRQDERRAGRLAEGSPGDGRRARKSSTNQRKEDVVSVSEKLKELSVVDGFLGAGLFTPAGESLGVVSSSGFTKEIGVLANNVLQNAQRASIEMGTGRGQQVHVQAEKAHILVRCLNEGSDPLKSEPGKAHIHLVLALGSDDAIGMAKMKINSVIEKLADECRG